MSIEKLIRDANPVRPSDLAAGNSALARGALTRILRDHPDPRLMAGQAGLKARQARRRMLTAAGLVAAAGVAVAFLVSAVPAAPRHPAASRVTRPPVTKPSGLHALPATARQVLLTAAAHVVGGPVAGRYWRVTMVGGVTVPGGTSADPYDISLRTFADQWNPSSAGEKEWRIARQLGSRPATAADASAWRVAGSPTAWHSGKPADGYLADYPLEWIGTLAASAAASSRTASWQQSQGTVGFIEGDLAGLSAAQFRRLPTRPRGVAAVLRRHALKTSCGQNPGARYCASVDQLMWTEAVMLLQDPVTAAVRSATFKVMAGLPGVRLIGERTDPLGRLGYAIAPGAEDPAAKPGNFGPTRVILIDPGNGSLLATEEIGPMPRTVHCLSFDARNNCSGSTYYGRSYPGQVDTYMAVVSEGWTNASPPLPPRSAWSTYPVGSPGLPPLP